jgi:mannose-6-phosphate isomerase-like protein (cupin superfamily)
MSVLLTGRTIDGNGKPVDGTGFEYDSAGRLAELLARRISPLFSQPVTREWVFGLNLSKATGGEFERGVGIFTPGNKGPAEHFHPTYDEHFELVEGDFIFRIDGAERQAGAGEKFTVQKGVPHTFRCVGNTPGVVIVETRPAARTGEVIATLFGMAHEGLLTSQGQPKMMQAMVIGSEYADDTVFTSPPPNIAIPMAKALAPIGRMLGYRSTYPKYSEASFWSAHVEQPGHNGNGKS